MVDKVVVVGPVVHGVHGQAVELGSLVLVLTDQDRNLVEAAWK